MRLRTGLRPLGRWDILGAFGGLLSVNQDAGDQDTSDAPADAPSPETGDLDPEDRATLLWSPVAENLFGEELARIRKEGAVPSPPPPPVHEDLPLIPLPDDEERDSEGGEEDPEDDDEETPLQLVLPRRVRASAKAQVQGEIEQPEARPEGADSSEAAPDLVEKQGTASSCDERSEPAGPSSDRTADEPRTSMGGSEGELEAGEVRTGEIDTQDLRKGCLEAGPRGSDAERSRGQADETSVSVPSVEITGEIAEAARLALEEERRLSRTDPDTTMEVRRPRDLPRTNRECRICGRRITAPAERRFRGRPDSVHGFVCHNCHNTFCAAHVVRVSSLLRSLLFGGRFHCLLCLGHEADKAPSGRR